MRKYILYIKLFLLYTLSFRLYIIISRCIWYSQSTVFFNVYPLKLIQSITIYRIYINYTRQSIISLLSYRYYTHNTPHNVSIFDKLVCFFSPEKEWCGFQSYILHVNLLACIWFENYIDSKKGSSYRDSNSGYRNQNPRW